MIPIFIWELVAESRIWGKIRYKSLKKIRYKSLRNWTHSSLLLLYEGKIISFGTAVVLETQGRPKHQSQKADNGVW